MAVERSRTGAPLKPPASSAFGSPSTPTRDTRRIGCDHCVDVLRQQNLRDRAELLIAQIGRDLHRQRHVAPMALGQHLLLLP